MGHAEPSSGKRAGRASSDGRVLDAVHAEPRLQGTIRRSSCAREGMYLLERARRSADRRVVRPVLRQRRPLPQGDRRGGRRAARASSTSSRRSLRGHPKQFELASRVAALTPGDLNRIFFTNSGSESVDTAMKVALAYQQAQGQGGRTMFISRERAYHGVNFGGVVAGRHGEQPAPLRPDAARHRAHAPYARQGELLPAGRRQCTASSSPRTWCGFVNLYGAENIAACFVEPIAGSTGCLVPPKGYLKRLREICDATASCSSSTR